MRFFLAFSLMLPVAVFAQDISSGVAVASTALYSGGTSLGYIDQPSALGSGLGYGPSLPGLPNGPTLPSAPSQPLAPLGLTPQLPSAAADPLNPQSPADPQQPLIVQLASQSSASSSSTAITDASMPPSQKAAGTMAVKTFDSLQNVAANVSNLVKVVTAVSGQ
jgi:hypothetical protein